MNTMNELRQIEKASIEMFMNDSIPYFIGDVLDYGSGIQPYKKIIESNRCAIYSPFDRVSFPGSCATEDVGFFLPSNGWLWGAIVCNQVFQYVIDPQKLLWQFSRSIVPGGYLVMTYPTHWPEVEPEDLHRFTKAGMENMLKTAEFEIDKHVERWNIEYGEIILPVGYGVIARAT